MFFTSSVVYLINYTGPSAEKLPSESKDVSLSGVAALRFGEIDSVLEPCPLVWNAKTEEYTLALPARYQTDENSERYYSHAVLLSLRTGAAGASASIVTELSDLIVGKQVGSCVFLNTEAMKEQESPGFTIRVVSADKSQTKDYPVKIVYASSSTDTSVTLCGNVNLDTQFASGTYSYYLDYQNANVTGATMTATLPAGATATVNGTAYTSGSKINLDPKEDFYRLTVTAEDNSTVTSYYFVTRYADGTIPFATISDETKALAKEMLSGWYDALEESKYFGNYWRIFMAKATGNEDGSAYDFNGVYVKDPARHGMKQATDWAACIMEIVMLGYNPYKFPYYDGTTYYPEYDYVQALIKCGGGPWANNVWYHMASQVTGAPTIMLDAMRENAMERTLDLDTRGWVIASLSGGEPTKEMVRYVDGLHDVQDTSGTYTSLWTNQGWHGGGGVGGGNVYTIGCVLSAIASSGADPDKQFALDGHTPLATIKQTMYEDGLFKGTLPKDMIIGLGDILHGSNVWARYTLTADKYNDLIAKAKTLHIDTSAMPETFTQTTDCGKAYYDLYDAVYDALVKAGKTTEAKEMRPDVIWGTPYELHRQCERDAGGERFYGGRSEGP